MSIVSWALVGLTIGLLSGLMANGNGILEDIIVAIVGSTIAGWLYLTFTGLPVTHLSLLDTIVALVGSVAFLIIARSLTEGRATI